MQHKIIIIITVIIIIIIIIMVIIIIPILSFFSIEMKVQAGYQLLMQKSVISPFFALT